MVRVTVPQKLIAEPKAGPGVAPDHTGFGDAVYDENNVPPPEYRIRPVVRYVLTRFTHPYRSADGQYGNAGGSQLIAEFANEDIAHDIGQRLAAVDRMATAALG